jgi:polyvinyl alcohol dehydrogenase (cytochrome)
MRTHDTVTRIRGMVLSLAVVLTVAMVVATTPGHLPAGAAPTSSLTSGRSSCTASPTNGGWSDYRNGPANTGDNVSDSEIDSNSVSGLRPRWAKQGLVGVTGTPVVGHGVVYFGDWTGTVWALRLSTGAALWSTKVGADVIGSPALAGGALYVGAGSTLYRLDAADGRVVWRVTTNPNPYSQINASPIVVGNRVILGTAQFEEVVGKPPETFRGSIGAWDARSGRPLWNFLTTPNDATSGAGEGIWSTPAVDGRLGLLYVGTGQNISEPTGRLADSLLAIHITNGTLAWWSQFTRPDVFGVGNYTGKDADVGASPNLWSCGGRAMVGVGQKNGVYHALEAKSGKEMWDTRLTSGSTFGGALGSAAFLDGRLVVSSNVGDPASNATTNRSKILALQPATGRVLWSRSFAGNVFGPVTGVRGLAFVGTDAGRFYALSTVNGATEWTYTPPARAGGGASIVAGNVVWGYGFTLFHGPGPGGIVCFSVTGAGRVQQERGGMVPSTMAAPWSTRPAAVRS